MWFEGTPTSSFPDVEGADASPGRRDHLQRRHRGLRASGEARLVGSCVHFSPREMHYFRLSLSSSARGRSTFGPVIISPCLFFLSLPRPADGGWEGEVQSLPSVAIQHSILRVTRPAQKATPCAPRCHSRWRERLQRVPFVWPLFGLIFRL